VAHRPQMGDASTLNRSVAQKSVEEMPSFLNFQINLSPPGDQARQLSKVLWSPDHDIQILYR
jgi:hypothetical protein